MGRKAGVEEGYNYSPAMKQANIIWSAATLDAYGPRLDAALGRSLAASWKAKYALERSPRVIYGIARIPLVWGVIAAFLRGDLAHPGEARGIVRAPLRLVETIGSRTAA